MNTPLPLWWRAITKETDLYQSPFCSANSSEIQKKNKKERHLIFRWRLCQRNMALRPLCVPHHCSIDDEKYCTVITLKSIIQTPQMGALRGRLATNSHALCKGSDTSTEILKHIMQTCPVLMLLCAPPSPLS